MTTIQNEIAEFINHCKYEKNLSSKTMNYPEAYPLRHQMEYLVSDPEKRGIKPNYE